MASTYTPIASTTLNSTSYPVNFVSIPQTYTDLVLVCSLISPDTVGPSVLASVNSDGNANYSNTTLDGNGTSGTSQRRTNATNIKLMDQGGLSTTIGNSTTTITHFMNYSSTSLFKTILTRGNTSTSMVELGVNSWRSTAAISSISIFVVAGAGFAAGSTFTLYGIKAA